MGGRSPGWSPARSSHAGCGCARQDVREKRTAGKFDLGETHCGRLRSGSCEVVAFLTARADVRGQLLAHLLALPAERKSAELKNAERFLQRMEKDPGTA